MSDFETLWTVARQAPLSMGFSRQECPPPGDLPDPGIELTSLMSPAFVSSLPLAQPGKPQVQVTVQNKPTVCSGTVAESCTQILISPFFLHP